MKNIYALGLGAVLAAGLSFGISWAVDVAMIAAIEFLFIAAALMVILKVMKRRASPYLLSGAAVALVTLVSISMDVR